MNIYEENYFMLMIKTNTNKLLRTDSGMSVSRQNPELYTKIKHA